MTCGSWNTGPARCTAATSGSSCRRRASSEHMIHVGFTIQDQALANKFYHDILGFNEFWHGGMRDDVADWVDMRVPDGADWLE